MTGVQAAASGTLPCACLTSTRLWTASSRQVGTFTNPQSCQAHRASQPLHAPAAGPCLRKQALHRHASAQLAAHSKHLIAWQPGTGMLKAPSSSPKLKALSREVMGINSVLRCLQEARCREMQGP